MNDEIQRIISGKSQVRYGAAVQAAIGYLRGSKKSGALDKTDKRFKREETEELKKYIEAHRLWVKDIDLNNYVSEGAEQKVYLKDSKSVIKGIILEDLHDENVLTSNGILYFIDTVFYLK